MLTKKQLQKTVYEYYERHGRKLPWRLHSATPYHIMVSEVMLQQTQAYRVVPKYRLFINTFPTVKKLAKATLRDILIVWQGLGYNRRALLLKKTAEQIVKRYQGCIPHIEKELIALPGIGSYTARAILTFAYNQPHPLIETNVRSVYIHHFFKNKIIIKDSEILPLIKRTLDKKNPKEWYAALMDYGSELKKKEKTLSKKSAHYVLQSPFKNSDRKIRGEILRLLTKKAAPLYTLQNKTGMPRTRLVTILTKMTKDGLIRKTLQAYTIA